MQETSAFENTGSSQHITWYLDFSSKQLKEQLALFKYSHIPKWTMWMFASAMTAAFVGFWVAALIYDQGLFAILLCILTFTCSILPLWCATILRHQNELHFTAGGKAVQKYLESFVALSLVISTALVIVMRLLHGLCSYDRDLSYLSTFTCTPFGFSRHLPYDTVIVLLFLPVLCSSVFVCMLWEVVIVANLIAFVTVIAAAIERRASYLSAFVFFTVAFLSILQYTYRLHYLELFLYKSRYQSVAEVRIQEQEEAAGRLVNEMQNMVTSISHDTKTPLAAFSCGMDAMNATIAGFKAEADHHAYIDSNTIKIATQEIKETLSGLYASYMMLIMTINRCIDYTKACHHIALVPNLEIVNLNEVIAEVLHTAESLNGNEIKLEQYDANTFSHIVTDRQWLQENLLCLCSNAIKYSPHKSSVIVSVSLRLCCFTPEQSSHGLSRNFTDGCDGNNEQYLHFEVHNRGDNASLSVLDQLFHCLPNFDKQRSMGGMGLGLYCLGQRVAVLKGSYGVSNVYKPEARGLMFWFEIPFRPNVVFLKSLSNSVRSKPMKQRADALDSTHIELVDRRERSNRLQINSSAGSSTDNMPVKAGAGSSNDSTIVVDDLPVISAMSVLVVDDSRAILKMVRVMLENHGHTVHTATDGSEAITLVKDHQDRPSWDLLLIDLQMPVMDGFTAVRAIREAEKVTSGNNRHRQLIIAMSANSDSHTVSEAYDAGADYFIPKPFKLVSLYNLLQEHFKRLDLSRSQSM